MKRRIFTISAILLVAIFFSSCELLFPSKSSGSESKTGIVLDQHELTLVAGQTATLKATITPKTTSSTIFWDEEDYSIVSVGLYTGLVTAKKMGTTTITATAYINEIKYTDTCTVTVTERAPTEYTNFGYYMNGEITAAVPELWYHATVVPGKKYQINMKDLSDHDTTDTYTLDAKLSAYRADKSTSYFTGFYNAFTTAKTITIVAGETDLYLKVMPYYNYSDIIGTFAVGITELEDSGSVHVTIE